MDLVNEFVRMNFITEILTVKPVVLFHSKIDKTKVLKTNGSLMVAALSDNRS